MDIEEMMKYYQDLKDELLKDKDKNKSELAFIDRVLKSYQELLL